MTAPGRLSPWDLTPRQVRLIDMAAEGMGNKEIGAEIGICRQTVKNQLSVVYRAMGIEPGLYDARVLACVRWAQWCAR